MTHSRSIVHRLLLLLFGGCQALIPFIDGGNDMPVLYNAWFNYQISKQASVAVSKAVAAGKKQIEVNFPPVPNVDEVKFGTPLNKKFGTSLIAPDLNIPGGYQPGSQVSRNLISYANIYWAKQLAPSMGAGFAGKKCSVLTAEPLDFSEIKSKGWHIGFMGPLAKRGIEAVSSLQSSIIVINPGGEETWNQMRSVCQCPSSSPFLILNNAYSTTYDLGNKRGYEEAYYLKRISKGWVFRVFPGPWKAYLERPDGNVELLKSYPQKPALGEVSALVRDESFKRFAINNDRFAKGFGGRI